MTTKIEWATEVWNPVTGCTAISEGCQNCYAKRMAQRLKGRFGYPEDEPFRVTFHPDKLDQPLRWKKPRWVFVCSMADLFHEAVTEYQWIAVFDTIRRSIYNGGGPGHKFLILTKRPYTMKLVMENLKWNGDRLTFNRGTPFISLCGDAVWLGISAENQNRLDERWSILAQIRTAKRFVSLEPLLSDIILKSWCPSCQKLLLGSLSETCGSCFTKTIRHDWIIAGCESGPNRRQAKIEWFRDLKNQCVAAGVPFFLKQMEGIAEVKSKKWGTMVKSTVIKMPQLDGRTWEEKP